LGCNGCRLPSAFRYFREPRYGRRAGWSSPPSCSHLHVGARIEETCGWCLSRANARSGEPAKISGYLGKSDAFDKAVADFSIAYADQSERDHDTLMKAVRAGRLEVFIEQEV
jgi:Uncharacterized protein conserved in bacteria (DUF2252)